MSNAIKNMIESYDALVDKAQCVFVPLLLLFCRLWVAWVFFNSGLTKIASWDSTLYLLSTNIRCRFYLGSWRLTWVPPPSLFCLLS